MKSKNALVFYARIPEENMQGKTRIGKEIQNQNIANKLARALIIDTFNEYISHANTHYDFIWYYKGNEESFQNEHVKFIPQISGELSLHHIHKNLANDYKNIIIVGSDIPCISSKNILQSFQIFENTQQKQCVIQPVEDGGYGLIGMNGFYDLYSNIQNWNSGTPGYALVEETKNIAKQIGVNIQFLEKTFDIDYKKDVIQLSKVIHNYPYLKETTKVIQNNPLLLNHM